jgi:hypothetical protein
LDTTGVVAGDNDAPQSMGDLNIEVLFFIKNCFKY